MISCFGKVRGMSKGAALQMKFPGLVFKDKESVCWLMMSLLNELNSQSVRQLLQKCPLLEHLLLLENILLDVKLDSLLK